MEAKAIARHIRMSPRKVRLLADLIRGQNIAQAETQLLLAAKLSKTPLLKLLRSAATNAEAKGMAKEKLYVKAITVNMGPSLKRFRPRAFGRAAPIRKHSCHINIVLSER